MKHELSKERLTQIISAIECEAYDEEEIVKSVSSGELLSLARYRLAAHEQEPVAWRYRFVHTPKSLEHGSPFTTDWVMTNSEDDCNPSDCFERQPLYAHPAPSIPAAVPEDIGEIRVGRLPTMNQDEYPGLGEWWVQLRIGDDFGEVLARVYGATPQEANNRAEAIARRAAMLNGGKS